MLEVVIEEFIDYCNISDFADKSKETLTIRLNEFNGFLKTTSATSIQDITYLHIRTFVGSYNNPSIHTTKARVWSLRQFFHFLTLNGRVDQNIALSLPYPKLEKRVPEFLTIDEYNNLLNHFHEKATDVKGLRDLAIIMILGIMGLRLKSILSINVEDIDLESGLIWIMEKGRKERFVIMPGILCHVLFKYLKAHDKNEGALFVSKRKKRISPRTVQDIFQSASLTLGFEKHLHAHLFRHTAATHLNRVSDPEITQHVLGHMWRKNTDHYTHLNPDQYAMYMKRHPYMKGGKR
jgi:integrase/recombinase XerC